MKVDDDSLGGSADLGIWVSILKLASPLQHTIHLQLSIRAQKSVVHGFERFGEGGGEVGEVWGVQGCCVATVFC